MFLMIGVNDGQNALYFSTTKNSCTSPTSGEP